MAQQPPTLTLLRALSNETKHILRLLNGLNAYTATLDDTWSVIHQVVEDVESMKDSAHYFASLIKQVKQDLQPNLTTEISASPLILPEAPLARFTAVAFARLSAEQIGESPEIAYQTLRTVEDRANYLQSLIQLLTEAHFPAEIVTTWQRVLFRTVECIESGAELAYELVEHPARHYGRRRELAYSNTGWAPWP